MTISPNARTIFRNYVMDGVPSSGDYDVEKSAERTWGTAVETAIDAYSSGAGSIAKSTRALLYADLAHVADVMAWVYADSTAVYNGIYRKSGGTGTGSWTRILDLPYDVITATDLGAGTANAIVATTEIPVSEPALILLNVFEANTGATTVAFNGGSALTIKTAAGNDVVSGGLVAGMALLGKITGSTFRMVSDQASAAIQAAAEAAALAAEAALAAIDLPPVTANTMLVDNAAGTDRETKTFPQVRELLGVWYKNANFSMPNALDNLVLYVMTTGSDTISDIATHGQTTGTAFLTIDAALNYAKKYWEFHGRMTVLELRVGPGSWGVFATGSSLEQAYDGYPFGIFLTAEDAATPANWPEFTTISIGGFLNKSVYVKNVTAGVFGVTRMNILNVNDVRVKDTGSSYCFYASLKGQLHVFGDIEVVEPVSYSSSFIYAQSQGSIALENGDAPLVFPMVNLINPGNITSPSKYRAVFGAYIYCPANIWPQLTYASTFHTDHTSFSSQTTTGTDAKYNIATGGESVAWGGTTTAGYEWFVDGRLHKWGTVVLSSLPTGNTAVAGTITFDTTVPFGNAPRVHVSCNNSLVNVAKAAGGTAAVTQNVGAYNLSASAQSTTVTWDAWGLM